MSNDTRITDEERAEWLRLCGNATDGPWAFELVGDDNRWCLGSTEPPHEGEIVEAYDERRGSYAPKPEVVDFVVESGNDGTRDDARFICAARSAMPRLLTAEAALRAELRTTAIAHLEQLERLTVERDALRVGLREALACLEPLADADDFRAMRDAVPDVVEELRKLLDEEVRDGT